jgi:hypothetical protein
MAARKRRENAWARRRWNATRVFAVLVAMTCASPAFALRTDFSVFNDKQSYSGVLLQQGRVQVDDDWNEEGDIQNDQSWGIFRFAFDPSVVRLAGVPGIVSGLAVGSPDGTLGGDQGVTLRLSPGLGVTAFGANIEFTDPAFLDYFRLVVGCPDRPCIFASAPPDAQLVGPGTFFFGVIAAPGFAFDAVTLETVTPRDSQGEPTATVPGWQVASISYAPVPEPSTLFLIALSFAALGAGCRRAQRQM